MHADGRTDQAARQVFALLRIGFTVAPILFGVSAWLAGIVVNLLTNDPPTYYDIALRDVGLLLGALALTRLAWALSAADRSRASVPVPAPAASATRV